MTPTRIFNGAEAIRAEERRRELSKRKELSPYAWLYPPPEAIRVHRVGTIGLPAASAITEVLAYQVPNNMYFWLTAIVRLYLGGNTSTIIPGDGHVAFDLDVNIPVGITSPQGYQVQGFSETLGTGSGIPYGNFQGGINSPYPLVMPELIGPSDTLRAKVTVDATPAAGRIYASFDGWLVKL